MIVRFDKQTGPTAEELDQLPSKLPEGLDGVGMGLGSGGNPLTNVVANLPSASQSKPMEDNNAAAAAAAANSMENMQAIANIARQMTMNMQGQMAGTAASGGADHNSGYMGKDISI